MNEKKNEEVRGTFEFLKNCNEKLEAKGKIQKVLGKAQAKFRDVKKDVKDAVKEAAK